MSSYTVFLTRSAGKDLEYLDKSTNRRIAAKIDALRTAPFPSGCVKLSGSNKNRWRIRIGDYRVVYDVDQSAKTVDIIAISHRREVYRQLH